MTGCTDAILATLRREIEQRRAVLDAAGDLGEVTLRVRLHAGTSTVKGVVWEEERVYRRVGVTPKEASDTLRT
jgi:hypothetical protein